MTVPYESIGRTAQKSRTRTALLEATRELLAAGLSPQVEDAAQRAGISRTTAYRYFANQRSLLMAARPAIAPESLLPAGPPADPAARLDGWIAEALAPLRETRPGVDIRRLAIAIRSATGIEALIWLIDVAGYTREQAAATVKLTARALLDAAA